MSGGPAIVFACVCKGVDYTARAGNKERLKNTLDAFVEGTVSGSQSSKEKGSFTHGPYTYNFVKDRGFTFIVIARKEVELRIVFSFLKEMMDLFNAGTDKAKFSRDLDALITQYSNPDEVDKVRRIAVEVEEVKGIMKQNLANMVLRGEMLQTLDESVQELEKSSFAFKEKAVEVKKVVWWRDLRCKIIIGVVLVIVIFVIVVIACGGFQFPNCKSSQ